MHKISKQIFFSGRSGLADPDGTATEWKTWKLKKVGIKRRVTVQETHVIETPPFGTIFKNWFRSQGYHVSLAASSCPTFTADAFIMESARKRASCVLSLVLLLSLHVASSPLWSMVQDNYDRALPAVLDFTSVFESRQDKLNRHKHLREVLQSTILSVDQHRLRRLQNALLILDAELSMLGHSAGDEEEEGWPSGSGRDLDGLLQPRTMVSSEVHEGGRRVAESADGDFGVDLIPLKKRKPRLSVDQALRTISDYNEDLEHRRDYEEKVAFAESRLLRAGK